jgi:hypothetical protein
MSGHTPVVSPSAREALVDVASELPRGAPCPSCGCPVESGDRFCPACGTAHPGPPAAESGTPDPAARRLKCNTCGAQISNAVDRRSYSCPFCESHYVAELPEPLSGRQRPEFAIGFAITADEAAEQFRAWINRRGLFTPGDLRQAMTVEKLQGIYLPFWSFSMLAESGWRAEIGEHWYRTETYQETDSKGNTVTKTRQVQETEWWPLTGRHHRYYSGYLVSASHGLPQNEAQQIMPFQLPALKRFEPYFLAGWLCEEYSVERQEALQRSQDEFYRREQAHIADFLPGDTHRQLQVRTEFSHENSDLCLLPVYLLPFSYRGKKYRFLMNGQTGKWLGRKPISWMRVLLAVLGGLALVLLMLLIGGLLAHTLS